MEGELGEYANKCFSATTMEIYLPGRIVEQLFVYGLYGWAVAHTGFVV